MSRVLAHLRLLRPHRAARSRSQDERAARQILYPTTGRRVQATPIRPPIESGRAVGAADRTTQGDDPSHEHR